MRIREATIDDTAAMAHIQGETKRALYPAFYPAELLAQLSDQKTEAGWRQNVFEKPLRPGVFALLAEDNTDQPVGVLIAGPEAGHDSRYQAEIYVLYVLPNFHGQGIGRALLVEAARHLLQRGMTSLLIWVLADNPSRAFYAALGGQLIHARDLQMHGYTLPEVAYGWQDMRLLTANPAADHSLDRKGSKP